MLGDCPSELNEGFIKWDDEHQQLDVPNKRFGVLPDGEYNDVTTRINYCCSTKGDINAPISLPNVKPFYLLAYGGPQCQHVAGTRVCNV